MLRSLLGILPRSVFMRGWCVFYIPCFMRACYRYKNCKDWFSRAFFLETSRP